VASFSDAIVSVDALLILRTDRKLEEMKMLRCQFHQSDSKMTMLGYSFDLPTDAIQCLSTQQRLRRLLTIATRQIASQLRYCAYCM
jgi:hypothetical protein